MHGLDGKIEAVDAKVDRVDAKVDLVDAKVDGLDTKLGNFMTSVDAQFQQVNRTAALNLDIVMKALDARRS